MKTQVGYPTSQQMSLDEFDELYQLYLQFLRDAQAEVRRRSVGGEREAKLAYCEPLPREYFEAKLDSARRDPERFSEIVTRLRLGYAI